MKKKKKNAEFQVLTALAVKIVSGWRYLTAKVHFVTPPKDLNLNKTCNVCIM
jgi:hypothetical protein